MIGEPPIIPWKKIYTSRLDICHKHHKQRLCKLILTLGKISHGEEISCVIQRFFEVFDKVDIVK